MCYPLNIKECVIFDAYFKPTEEFEKFYTELGYTIYDFYKFGDANFDNRIISYIKEYSDWRSDGEVRYALKGAESHLFKIGFSGLASVLEVDIDRPWVIKYTSRDTPYVDYVKLEVNSYNHAWVTYGA